MQVDEDLKKAKDTLERMCEGSTSTPKVIILTMCENPRILREVMKLGPNTFSQECLGRGTALRDAHHSR